MTPIARAALAALFGLWTCGSTERLLRASEGFRDDFSAYAEGSSGAPRWTVAAGDWSVRGGKLVQTADGAGLAVTAEALAGTFRGADPRRPDTDGDGALDGADRLPLDLTFRSGAEVPRGTPALDGAWTAGEWQEVGRAAEAGVVVGARWDGDALYVAARAARPVRVAFEVDARNDGWFLEDDNAFAELEVTGGGSPPVHGAPGARSAGSGGESAPVAEAALPAPWAPALARRAGARFGLCVRVAWREGDGEAARDREVFLASPWELVEMALAGSPL